MYIIIKNKKGKPNNIGKTRSEQEENLRKEWGPTITNEQLDKLKFLEKKMKQKTGSQDNFVDAHVIDQVK